MVNNYRMFNHIFNLGIDFTGGTSIILRFNKPLSNPEFQLRPILINLNLEKHTIQTSVSQILLSKQNKWMLKKEISCLMILIKRYLRLIF